MKVAKLTKWAEEIASARQYDRKGPLFWKRSLELHRLMHFQRSAWGGGVYVNVGVTPNSMVTRRTPPGPGYWAFQIRPTSFKHKYFAMFVACEDDNEDEVPASSMVSAVEWLFTWMEEHLAEERLRMEVLKEDSWVQKSGRVTAMLRDWAAGRLKRPQHYYDGGRYYRDV